VRNSERRTSVVETPDRSHGGCPASDRATSSEAQRQFLDRQVEPDREGLGRGKIPAMPLGRKLLPPLFGWDVGEQAGVEGPA